MLNWLSLNQEIGTNVIAIILVPGCFTFILSRARNKYYGHYFWSGMLYFHLTIARNKYYGHYMYICSGLLYFHLLKSPEQILWLLYLFWVALLYTERNEYYGHNIWSGLLYFHLVRNKYQIALLSFIKGPRINITVIYFVRPASNLFTKALRPKIMFQPCFSPYFMIFFLIPRS